MHACMIRTIGTQSAQPLDKFMMQLNKNTFGLAPANQAVSVGEPRS